MPLPAHDSIRHPLELTAIGPNTTRAFAEADCWRESWPVYERRRQIAILCCDTSGPRTDKAVDSGLAQQAEGRAAPRLTLRGPCVFELQGSRVQEATGQIRS